MATGRRLDTQSKVFENLVEREGFSSVIDYQSDALFVDFGFLLEVLITKRVTEVERLYCWAKSPIPGGTRPGRNWFPNGPSLPPKGTKVSVGSSRSFNVLFARRTIRPERIHLEILKEFIKSSWQRERMDHTIANGQMAQVGSYVLFLGLLTFRLVEPKEISDELALDLSK